MLFNDAQVFFMFLKVKKNKIKRCYRIKQKI